jgi:eukaryotic-like serine/threonine-protein kinase
VADLVGKTTSAGWLVVEKVQFPPDHTGGYFSECFLVERGRDKAFMKLLDISNFSDLNELLDGLAAFSYETSLVKHTTANGLSRVVSLLESGEIEVDPLNPVGILRRIPYLVFERGNGDIRSTVDVSKAVADNWRFCVLHRAAAGLLQLHQANIAHQDLKPSNVIQMESDRLKIADLGRSTMRGNSAPHDGLPIAGALSYAPFELAYSYLLPDWTQRRLATDVFHLGCLTVFVFTNCVLPSQVLARLEPAYRPGAWGDAYAGVVPHIKNALDEVLDEMSGDFPARFRDDLLAIVRDLCHPDPLKRGAAAKTGTAVGTSLWLQRYVSRFDLLHRKASVGQPRARNV